MIYFDHNATTPLLPEARQVWLEASEQFMANPSSPHRLGARAEQALDQARHQLATFLECDSLDIIWTSGATESNNLVLFHLAQTLPSDAHAWISSIEHPCVLQAAQYYFPNRHRLIPVSAAGIADLDWVTDQFKRERPSFVALMAANNETGLLQPWNELLNLCRSKEIPFFCDAAQWFGKLPTQGLGSCDFVSGCAHKFGGPRGVGFLKAPSLLKPLIKGGPQEDGRRAGTENLPGVLAMLAALRKREDQIHNQEHLPKQAWRESFVDSLATHLPGSRITAGKKSPSLWNTVSAVMPETNCRHRWVVKLDKAGVAVSTGSACSSGKEEISHVLNAMNLSPADAARVLRISSGWETSESEWQRLLQCLKRVHEELALL